MRVLTEAEFLTEAEPILRKVFVRDDPYNGLFTDGIEGKAILFEYWYEMEEPLLSSIIKASSEYGDNGFYLSILDRPSAKDQQQPYHWYISFDDITSYRGLVGPLQNVVYSQQGVWGIVASDEHHGLLGCRGDFMQRLVALVPGIEEQIYSFLAFWKDNKDTLNSDITWLPHLLSHVYGLEMARNLLKEYHLDMQ